MRQEEGQGATHVHTLVEGASVIDVLLIEVYMGVYVCVCLCASLSLFLLLLLSFTVSIVWPTRRMQHMSRSHVSFFCLVVCLVACQII